MTGESLHGVIPQPCATSKSHREKQAAATMKPPDPFAALATIVAHNLEHQHDWSELRIYQLSLQPAGTLQHIISGLPPRRIYVHPDEQIAIIKAERSTNGRPVPQPPEREWVLPAHLAEKWTLGQFAAVFDAIPSLPPAPPSKANHGLPGTDNGFAEADWMQWRGSKRGKRLLLATVQDDSTILYYLMHDGIVKPRQN